MSRAIPFDRHLAKLRFTSPARLPFQHGAVAMGLLSRSLGEHLPLGAIAVVPESGRVEYERGDFYHLGVTLVGPTRALADDLARGLEQAGASSARPGVLLGGNFELAHFEQLPAPDIDAQVARIASAARIDLRLLSPLWLERPPADRRPGRTRVDRYCFPPGWFFNRLASRLDHLEALAAGADLPKNTPALPSSARLATPPDLHFIDVPSPGRHDKNRSQPEGITIGGVLGLVSFEDLSDAERYDLVLGQYVHAGEKVHFGFGRYAVEAGSRWNHDLGPAATMLDRLAVPQTLERALDRVLERGSSAEGYDGVSPAELSSRRAHELPLLAHELASGRYFPQPLSGFVIPKSSGGVRGLTIPATRDRVVQRAVADLLSPAIDSELESSSFAYRKGLSRVGAARAIERAWRDGFRHVLDADITAFFDSVPWDRLFGKLRAYFPLDPLVDLLETWVQQPVVYQGRIIERRQGLPQGLAISPVLANLYLDELDERFLGEDFRLVRYADDFVVLARDPEGARHAKTIAEQALAELGLELHPEKTTIRPLEEGLEYLGYGFLTRTNTTAPPSDPARPSSAIPLVSWLVHVPLAEIRALEQPATGRQQRGPEPIPLRSVDSSPALPRRPLVLADGSVAVRLAQEALLLERDGSLMHTVRIRTLSEVLVIGAPRITLPAVLALGRAGVPVAFGDRFGDLYASCDPRPTDPGLLLAQARAASDPQLRREFASAVVEAKLRSCAAVAVRLGWDGVGELAPSLRELARSASSAPDLDHLRGLEGRGAALYFAALGRSLPPEWSFAGRARRPPPDAINALLSFGYTLLYHRTRCAVRLAGLDPRVGLFHSSHGAFAALAADLMEELRPVIDSRVWTFVARRELVADDFRRSGAGVYLSGDARKRVLRAFEERLAENFTPPDGRTLPYTGHLIEQARQLADLIATRRDRYLPLRFDR